MVITDSSLVVSRFSPTAVIQLHIPTDNVRDDLEDFTLSLELTEKNPITSFSIARNEFFVDSAKVVIQDSTGKT